MQDSAVVIKLPNIGARSLSNFKASAEYRPKRSFFSPPFNRYFDDGVQNRWDFLARAGFSFRRPKSGSLLDNIEFYFVLT